MLENRADKTINQFNKGRCQILGVNNSMQQRRLIADQLRSSLAKKGLEVLVNSFMQASDVPCGK